MIPTIEGVSKCKLRCTLCFYFKYIRWLACQRLDRRSRIFGRVAKTFSLKFGNFTSFFIKNFLHLQDREDHPCY